MARIVVAENDERQARVLQAYLGREGHSVVTASDGRAALEEIRRLEPHLVILDVMMAKVDGLDVCRVLLVDSNVPIIMVSARSTEDDLLLGLNLGADDYITKPYSPRELLARVRTVLRRTSRSDPASPAIVIGELCIDFDRVEVRRGKRLIDLTLRALGLLVALLPPTASR